VTLVASSLCTRLKARASRRPTQLDGGRGIAKPQTARGSQDRAEATPLPSADVKHLGRITGIRHHITANRRSRSTANQILRFFTGAILVFAPGATFTLGFLRGRFTDVSFAAISSGLRVH
jgi:hypothetical protein